MKKLHAIKINEFICSVILTIGFLCGVCSFTNSQRVNASSIDWLSPSIKAETNNRDIRDTDYSVVYPCTQRQVTVGTITVQGKSLSGSACVFQAKSFRFGGMRYCWPNTYSPGCTDHYFMLIGFSGDNHMYVVQNMHDSMYNLCWQVMPSTNDLIDACNGFIGIVKDLPSHLSSTTGNTGPEYNYDQSATHHFQDDTGAYPRIYASNMSENGKWIAVEISGYGLARIRVSDYNIQLFHLGTASYGLGRDPSYNFSITNDGRYVSVSGGNLGAKIYDLNGNCGAVSSVILSAWRNNGQQSIGYTACPSQDIAQILINIDGGPGAGFRVFTNTRFSEDGGQLEGVFTPYQYTNGGTTTWVTLTAANYIPVTRLDYLAFGDSYSSGEGDVADGSSHYIRDENSCHLSTRSYPFLLRDYWGLSPKSMESVACSGARVLPDYIGEGDYYGQHNQMNKWNDTRITETRSAALENFTPGATKQIEFIKRYKPEKVTFTGGGNDVGFASILEYCAASYRILKILPTEETCAFASNSKMRANLNKTIDDQYDINKMLVEKIHDVSPSTKIYMIGYPQFVAVEGPTCTNDSVVLNKTERQMIHDGVSRLNNVLKKVARDTGVYYVDVENSLDGGEICQGSEYMTGPLKMIVSNRSFNEDPNMFHPNADGHEKIAEAIEQQFSTGLDYTVLDIPDEQNGMRTIQTAVLPDYSGVGSTHTVTMDPGMFMPNGEVSIELFSQSINLGTARIANDGSLHANITIPKDVAPGYHLLTITGTDTNGESVQLQQFVSLTSGITDDMDGDGILDQDDTCNFISSWYIGDKDTCLESKVSREGSVKTNIPTSATKLAPTNLQDGNNPTDIFNTRSSLTSPDKKEVGSNNKFVKPEHLKIKWTPFIGMGVVAVVACIVYGIIKQRRTHA